MIDHPFEEKFMFDEWIIPQLESQPEEGLALEVGVRRGGTSFAFIQAIAGSSKPNRPMLGCDPWGDLPYAVGERIEQPNYGESFYRDAMVSLSIVAKECNVFHHVMRLTSYDFMKIFDDISFYRDGKELSKKFSVVYLDGLHSVEAVSTELEWFRERMMPNGMIIVDDTHEIAFSDHPTIKWMFENGEVRKERTMLIIP
jgi:hypothetical protein